MNVRSETAWLVIRNAVEEDLAACLRLDHSYSTEFVWQMEVQEESGRVGAIFRTVHLPRPMHVLYPRDAETLRASWGGRDCFLVATVGDRVRGYLNMRADVAQANGWVVDLAVAPVWRRRGMGGALLKAARLWAHEHGLSRLTVEVQTKNFPGICFCQKHGLTFCGFNDKYYPNQDIALFFGQSIR
jgi:GNAT superfamily N-acetyltransferase